VKGKKLPGRKALTSTIERRQRPRPRRWPPRQLAHGQRHADRQHGGDQRRPGRPRSSGPPPGVLVALEQARSNPSLAALAKISDALGVPLTWLAERKEGPGDA
jgi:hypothetical protein